MDQESFEDIIGKKFDSKVAKAPTSVWEGVQQSLDADLLALHQGRSRRYFFVAAAAVLLALLSFAFLLLERFPAPDASEQVSFNALTGDVPAVDPFYTPSFSSKGSSGFSVIYVGTEVQRASSSGSGSVNQFPAGDDQPIEVYEEPSLPESRRPGIGLAESEARDIYSYRTISRSAAVATEPSSSNRKVWAGVEAGAGGFNGSLSSSQTLASTVNTTNLASSAGLSDFVNPTNTVSQNSGTGTTRSIGIDLGMEIGKRWTLESGFSLNSMQNSTEAAINVLDVYTIDARQFGSVPAGLGGLGEDSRSSLGAEQVEIRESFDTEVEVESRVQFASIPIKAGYFLVKRKFSLRLNAGLAANYLLDGNVSDPTNQIFSNANATLYNDWSFDGLSGLEFGISLFENFDFTLEPNYSHSIVPVTETNHAASRFMVQTGLRYRIQ